MGSLTNVERSEVSGVMGDIRKPMMRRKPLVAAYVSLVAFMVVYCARPEDWIPGLSTAPLVKITGIMALIALALSLQHIRDHMPREIFLLGFLIVQLFIASLLSPVWRGGALQITLDFAKVLIIAILITTIVTTVERLRVVIFTQALSLSAIAAVTIWKGHLILGRLEGILNGNYADPNDMALAIVISIPLCLALLFLSKNWLSTVCWSASIFVMAYAVFLTGSRGGFLALAVVTVVCLWEFAVRGRRHYLLAVAFVAVVVLWRFSGGMMAGRLNGTFNSEDDTAAAYSSGQARQQLFWRSIEITKEHPLFGVGPGNFDAVSGQWHTTHNSLTLMSSEAGLPALVLYVLILWSGFKNLNATKRLVRGRTKSGVLTRALFASLIGYTVGSFFLSFSYQYFLYILVAYTTALLSITRKAVAQSRRDESAQQTAVEKTPYLDLSESETSWRTS
jgi:putative inorganic carbon (HCO3(-)) transporter